MPFTLDSLRTKTMYVNHLKFRNPWNIERKNPFSALWYIHKGHMILQIDNETMHLYPGTIALIRTQIPFRAQIASHDHFVRMTLIRFQFLTVEHFDWLTLFRLPVKLNHPEISVGPRPFLDIGRTYHAPSPLSHFRTNAKVSLLLSTLLEPQMDRIHPVESTANQKYFTVKRVIDRMESDIAHKFSLQELAAVIPVSPDTLIDMFNDVTGLPPVQYLQRLRLQKAKTLLLQPELKVSWVGKKVGFDDPLYFSRVFKKQVGLSPSQYRREMIHF